MAEELAPLTGVFEGYLKKHKHVSSLTLFIEYNKRYFYLNPSQFKLLYFKNRKKNSKPSEIPLKEMLAVVKMTEEQDRAKLNGGSEWGYEFQVCTRSRTYLLNAYSWNDREVWYNALKKVLDYKKFVLAARGVTLNDEEIDLKNPPSDQTKYDIIDTDFDGEFNIISPNEIASRTKQYLAAFPEQEERKEKSSDEDEGSSDNKENDEIKQNQSDSAQEETKDTEDKKRFMDNNEFMKQLQGMREGSNSRAKKLKIKKSKRAKTNRDSAGPDNEQAKAAKKKLKIKRKDSQSNAVDKANVVENFTSFDFAKPIEPQRTIEYNLPDFSKKEAPVRATVMEQPLKSIGGEQINNPSMRQGASRFSSFHDCDQKPPKPEGRARSNSKKAKGNKRRSQSKPSNRDQGKQDTRTDEKIDLLKKWENEYGGMKNRQYVVKSDYDPNRWYTSANNSPPDDDICEDLPEDDDAYDVNQYRQDVLKKNNPAPIEESNGKSEFDYDWDGDESMSYLKKLTDEQTKQRYERIKSDAQVKQSGGNKAREYNNNEPSQKQTGYKAQGNLLMNDKKKHFKSVAPQIDDWD